MSRGTKFKGRRNNRRIKWLLAKYIRLSKEDGNDKSYSVENQDKMLDRFIDTFPDECELVDSYIDDGQSGTDSDRENFQRLLADIYAKRVNCVIVKDLSRLSRNDYECGHYLEYVFVKLDVRFISLELPKLDSFTRPDEISSIATKMQSYMNDQHCYQTSIKVRSVLSMKMEDGDFIGAFAPYGYLKDPKNRHQLIINPETAPVVKNIYAWFVQDGMSKNAITKRLITEGVLSPSAYKRHLGMKYYNPNVKGEALWSHKTVDLILRNPTYLGDNVQGRHQVKSYKVHTVVPIPEDEWKVVEGTHEAIIDKAIFDKAQELHARNTHTAADKDYVSLFAGFLVCADCGHGMSRATSKGYKGNHHYVYYHCRTYVYKSHDLCTKHTIRGEKLEDAVLQAVRKQIELVETLSQVVEQINAAPVVRNESQRLNHQLKLREKELDRATELKDGLFMDWKNGDITKEEYHRMKAEFLEKIQRLEQVVENIHGEIATMANGISVDDPYLTTFLKYKNIDKLSRGLVVELIDQIRVHEGGGVEIDFTFGDQYRRIAEFIENNQRELSVVTSNAV